MIQRKPAEEVRSILEEWFHGAFAAELPAVRLDVGGRLELADGRYQPAPPDQILQIVRRTPQATHYDARDRYDCEDTALAARVAVAYDYLVANPREGLRVPPAFGFLFTIDHALNLGLDATWTPYLLDVRTERSSRLIDGNFLSELPSGWLATSRRIRYVFL
jgi:hypothetical protein